MKIVGGMKKKVAKIAITVIGVAVLLLIYSIFFDKPQDIAYINRTKRELRNMSENKDETSRRLAAIRQEGNCWSDGYVGITADGYVFYYDLHESHGMDNVRDLHILYLPDDKRFIIARGPHFCVDLSKWEQAKSKAEVIETFQSNEIAIW